MSNRPRRKCSTPVPGCSRCGAPSTEAVLGLLAVTKRTAELALVSACDEHADEAMALMVGEAMVRPIGSGREWVRIVADARRLMEDFAREVGAA